MKKITTLLDKAKYISESIKNNIPLYGKIISGERAGTIGKIISRIDLSRHNVWYLKNRKVRLQVAGRRPCSYLLLDIELLPDYTGPTIFVETKTVNEKIIPRDFLEQQILVGTPVFFQRPNKSILARVESINNKTGSITVKPLKINNTESSSFRNMRLNITERIICVNKTSLDSIMLLKLRI
jgi:hypothetical protein